MPSQDPVALLERSRTIAVVGCSTAPAKAAHYVPAALQAMGFEIWPVHPTATEVLGQAAVAHLADLDAAPDLVVVFRPSAEAAAVARDAVEAGARGIWLQQGITSPEARAAAEAAGIAYVEDRCAMVVAQQAGISRSGGSG